MSRRAVAGEIPDVNHVFDGNKAQPCQHYPAVFDVFVLPRHEPLYKLILKDDI